MITVETLPVRMSAVQWHAPGDHPEVVKSYRLGTEVRWGVHSAQRGMQRVTPGSWIVIGNGTADVYSQGEFALKFRIVQEENSR